MKLNTKVRYGLRAMIELAMNISEPGILQRDISERQEIPLKYLDKIISELKSAGLIVNVAGKKSGYHLSRSASKISVYDIYRAFEGKLAIIQCINENTICGRNCLCASQELWEKMNTELEATMIGKTLDQLVQRQKELNSENIESLSFQI
jgi:Rrf2 family protein